MSSALFELVSPGFRYGLQPERRSMKSESAAERRLQRWWKSRTRCQYNRFDPVLAELNALCSESSSDLATLRAALRRDGFTHELLVQLFAKVRLAVHEICGFELHDEQLFAAWAMLHRSMVEMQTGEGKSVTATVPAIAAALAGTSVHVVSVNDYLVARDAEKYAPLYQYFGLTVAAVTEDMDEDARRQAYAADVVYCNNKQLVFDYLRDRQRRRTRSASLEERLAPLTGNQHHEPLVRGLCFAIVDEADSVLIDDATTPLILAEPAHAGQRDITEAIVALGIARTLHLNTHFQIRKESARAILSASGEEAVRDLTQRLDGVWRFERYRMERVRQALMALHGLQRDRDYVLRNARVVLVDQSTGRLMPDRRLQHGVHRMLEIKEGVAMGDDHEVIASISFPDFFARYHALTGLSGTLSEVSDELDETYQTQVVSVPTHLPTQLDVLPGRFLIERAAQLNEMLMTVQRRHALGQPLLVGTRSVALSEQVSECLRSAGVEHNVLNARQDQNEADVIRQAGQRGSVTVATNMAGRGTDILVGGDAAALGGLHVLNLELNESIRVDRQLFGRAARHGQVGSAEHVLCLEDDLLCAQLSPLTNHCLRELMRIAPRSGAVLARSVVWMLRHSLASRARRHRQNLQRIRDGSLRMLTFGIDREND